jgi:hypothetical protein
MTTDPSGPRGPLPGIRSRRAELIDGAVQRWISARDLDDLPVARRGRRLLEIADSFSSSSSSAA